MYLHCVEKKCLQCQNTNNVRFFSHEIHFYKNLSTIPHQSIFLCNYRPRYCWTIAFRTSEKSVDIFISKPKPLKVDERRKFRYLRPNQFFHLTMNGLRSIKDFQIQNSTESSIIYRVETYNTKIHNEVGILEQTENDGHL